MGLWQRLFNKAPTPDKNTGYSIQLVTETGNGFYSWQGSLYKSDIIRSCIRPKAKAIGKLIAKHIREDANGLKVNPEPYMRFLLEEPNPYMTGQMLQEKLATQLELNNNAFALIVRDENGYPIQLYPVPCTSAQAEYTKSGDIRIKFRLRNGKTKTFDYRDLIHLRKDYNENDIFGDNQAETLTELMEVVTITDQGVIKAVQNSNVIKWLLKFKQVLRPEDVKKEVDSFVKSYLSIDSDTGGAAASDAKYDIEQVKQEGYVPAASQMDRTTQRIYSFFNTNSKIIQSSYDENGWNSYYESEIEPLARQMSEEFTRKLFNRKERSFGNRIVFEASSLQYAAMSTKLNLMQMVDRGALTPNEWRHILNLGPIEGGDKAVRRLDTAVVTNLEKKILDEIRLLLARGGEANGD